MTDPRPEVVKRWAQGATIRCPDCRGTAYIDEQQFRGEVSMVCPAQGCSYHKTVDFRKSEEA